MNQFIDLCPEHWSECLDETSDFPLLVAPLDLLVGGVTLVPCGPVLRSKLRKAHNTVFHQQQNPHIRYYETSDPLEVLPATKY